MFSQKSNLLVYFCFTMKNKFYHSIACEFDDFCPSRSLASCNALGLYILLLSGLFCITVLALKPFDLY